MSSSNKPKAILMDLGGVVVEIDFRRVFRYWAKQASVDEERFLQHWKMDDAYCAHEIGELTFKGYCQHLGQLFDISLSQAHWRQGWNEIFVGPFDGVIARVKALQTSHPVYAFTNTNHTHEACWRVHYPQVIAPFVKVFISSRIRRRKPDVEAYEYVAREMGYDAGDILFLDDNAENIAGAQKAGLTAIQVAGEEQVLRTLNDL